MNPYDIDPKTLKESKKPQDSLNLRLIRALDKLGFLTDVKITPKEVS